MDGGSAAAVWAICPHVVRGIDRRCGWLLALYASLDGNSRVQHCHAGCLLRDTIFGRHGFHERRMNMGFGLFVLAIGVVVCGYGSYMSNLGRKADRERRHTRVSR